jgi:hypothetical protein
VPFELEEFASQNTKLKEFLQTELANGPKSSEGLVNAAQRSGGFDFGEKSAARVIHFNLLNLKNSGLVDKEGELWKLRTAGKQTT